MGYMLGVIGLIIFFVLCLVGFLIWDKIWWKRHRQEIWARMERRAELKAFLPEHIQKRRRKMIVQCNWCMAVFSESEIIIKLEEEYCPYCNKTGYLMDLDKLDE